jgi:hypothetical protein
MGRCSACGEIAFYLIANRVKKRGELTMPYRPNRAITANKSHS